MFFEFLKNFFLNIYIRFRGGILWSYYFISLESTFKYVIIYRFFKDCKDLLLIFFLVGKIEDKVV